MYEYTFVEVKLNRPFFRERTPREDYHEIIKAHAENGWRLIQIFSPSVSVIDGGTSAFFELIFEKESEKDLSEKT
jgi:hypothetical protein